MSLTFPKRIDICPWLDVYTASPGAGGADARTQDSTNLGGGRRGFGGTVSGAGSYFEWQVLLEAGTWTLTEIFHKGANVGIHKILLDGVQIASGIDQYNAVNLMNNVNEVSGIVVASTGIKTLRFENTGKNASATYYGLAFQWITLRRTA